MTPVCPSSASPSPLATLLMAIPPDCRGTTLQYVVSFRPNPTLGSSISVGPLRAAFAEYWEAQVGFPVPVRQLRAALDPPIPIGTVTEFCKLSFAQDAAEVEVFLLQLVRHLCERLRKLDASQQLSLFDDALCPSCDQWQTANVRPIGTKP